MSAIYRTPEGEQALKAAYVGFRQAWPVPREGWIRKAADGGSPAPRRTRALSGCPRRAISWAA
jgi:hypothetical protein